MHYEETKIRTMKPKPNHQPLIPYKGRQDAREKENEKQNHEQRTRMHHHPDFTNTVQFEHKNNNYPTIPIHHHTQPHLVQREKYQQPQYYVQNPKTLTFANVKQGNKHREGSATENSSFIGLNQDHKRIPKNNALFQHRQSNLGERNEKPLIEPRKHEKHERNERHDRHEKHEKHEKHERHEKHEKYEKVEGGRNSKSPVFPCNDFRCMEQLEFKPVEKKSIVPEKKFAAQKTTSKFDFSKPKVLHERKNDFASQLRDFEAAEKEINNIDNGDLINLLCEKQQEYSVPVNFLEKNQKNLTWWSRAILVDWMRHISSEFLLQRDTYHIAVVILDNYLARTTNVSKSILQAIGATCLFMASKLQEFECKPSMDFVESTRNSCTCQDIHQLQFKIVKTLSFRLNPPTLYSLGNMLMTQWDIFIKEKGAGPYERKMVFFKESTQESYYLFRDLMQLIDCSVIDVQSAQYKQKMLVCSFMYLLLGQKMEVFDCQEILEEFPRSSRYLIDGQSIYSDYNRLFGSFVEQVLAISLFDMLPTVQYCATYFGLTFTHEQHDIGDLRDMETMSLTEYCSFQSYNNTMLKTIKHRHREIYC